MKFSLLLFLSTVSLLPYSTSNRFMRPADAPLASNADPATEWQPAQQDTAAKKLFFIAIYSLGPAWQTNKPAHEQAHFKEHSENLKKWRTEKKIALGARYSDKGMIIISAADEKEARAMLENDPMVMNKVFNLELYPFSPFYKGCLQ